MAEHLGSLARTHTCGALRVEDVGADVVVLGWVHRIRDLGGVTFIDIRDRAGISQVVVRENEALAAVAKRLRSEYVVGVSGVVQRRSADTINPKLATGEVEVLARDIRILNEAKTPPFQIAEDSPVSEDVRLKYRYLDLRRTRLQHNIGLRHRVSMAIFCGGRACSTTSACATACRWRSGNISTRTGSGRSRRRFSRSRRPRARAIFWCRAACIPASSTRC